MPDFWVWSMSFNGDGTLLAMARHGWTRFDPALEKVVIWDWRNDEVVRTIDQPVEAVAFDPTGTRLATSRFIEGTVDVWDGATGGHLFELVGHTGLVTDVVFSIDGRLIVTTGDDGTARMLGRNDRRTASCAARRRRPVQPDAQRRRLETGGGRPATV